MTLMCFNLGQTQLPDEATGGAAHTQTDRTHEDLKNNGEETGGPGLQRIL